jgi:hypothetical protein
MVQELENIRSRIKHADPEQVDLDDIRGTLGRVILDLQVLESLHHPTSFRLKQVEDGLVRVTIKMKLDPSEAEDMIEKLWLQSDS